MKRESYKVFSKIEKGDLAKIIIDKIPNNSVILKKEDPIVKRYLDLSSIETDLEFVKESVSMLLEIRITQSKTAIPNNYKDEKLVLKRSLYISSILSYARCFNKSNGRLSLSEKNLKKDFPIDLLNLENTLLFHKSLMDLRNKLIAHADEHPLEETVAFINFELNDNYLDSKIEYIYSNKYFPDEDELQNFLIISAFLIKQVEKEKDKISSKILAEIGEQNLLELGLKTLKSHN